VYRSVDPTSVVRTVERLHARVEERFPQSSLASVAAELVSVARASAERAAWTRRPLLFLRAGIGLLLVMVVVGVAQVGMGLRLGSGVQTLAELVQVVEAGINDLVFLGIGIFFLAGIETRVKRGRVLAALHELRSLAHIVDMHQLTKDPERLGDSGRSTASSPERSLSPFELGRYLEYCSEMLSLIGKLAALYAQSTSDPVALSAVDQVEDLSTGLAGKIWQKITLVHRRRRSDVALRRRVGMRA
jgi:hypothetical protein